MEAVAKAFHTAFHSAKPGSPAQNRALDTLMRLMSRLGDDGPVEELDSYTAQQLRGELAKELGVSEDDLTDKDVPEASTGAGEEGPPSNGGVSEA